MSLRRLVAAILATFVFWTPFATTVARAQARDFSEASREVIADGDSAADFAGAARDVLSREVDERTRREVARDPGGQLEERLKEDLEDHPELREAFDRDPGEAAERPPEEAQAEPPVPFNLPSGPSKTAVTPQQIVLPKGEGSIEGMGESFTPNLSSGTGTFSVPIALPKGRAGVQPSLALSYATSGGNGIVGQGWSLALPFISRQTDKGLPHYVDAAQWTVQEDRFIYNGGQELVPVDNAEAKAIDEGIVPGEFSGWQQYRARVEGGFMRFFRAPDASRWVVQSKDGTRFEFGASSVSGENTRAVVSDPEESRRIFAWYLVRMSDVHGSVVHYRYTEDAGTLYPESIYYTSPASCASANALAARDCSAPLDQYAQRVHFVYEAREDVSSSYLTSWRTEIGLRLKRLEITSAGDAVGTRYLVRRYHLRYDPDSYHSLLTSVQVEGRPAQKPDDVVGVPTGVLVAESKLSDIVIGQVLPPMTFGYTAAPSAGDEVAGFGGIDATVHESESSPDHSADEGRADLFDVNADGLPDLLVTDPARYKGGAGVYFNGFAGGVPTRAGSFGSGVRVDVPEAADALNLGSVNIVPMDIDGDGRSDLLHMPRTANYGYFVLGQTPAAPGRTYSPTQGWSFAHVTKLLPQGVTDPRIDLGKDGQSIKTLDVNGDHLIDVVQTAGSSLHSWLNLGRYPGGKGRFGSATFEGNGWSLSALPVDSCLPFAGQNLDFADESVRIADMNGDGLQDIVKVRPSEVVWWPGRGEGAWGDGPHGCDSDSRDDRELRMENPPRELNGELAGLHFVDVNADGASDLVYVGFSELSVWFNRGGQGFTERLVVDGTPYAVDALERVRIADIDGSTTTDIVFADSGRWRWIDPMGGVKPRLLESVDNGLGALTTLEYGSSTEDYLRDLSDLRSCPAGKLSPTQAVGAADSCFSWQGMQVKPGSSGEACDAWLLEKTGQCVHRSGNSPVVSTVVRAVRTTDRLEALGALPTTTETDYRYHDGYYEGIEQEFRGFGAADAVALGDEYEGTSITRTYFHQGRRPNELATDRLADNPNEALKGREYLTEVSDESGKYLKSSHATYAVRRLLTGLDERAISYAYVKESAEYRYDTALETQRPWNLEKHASVVREAAHQALLNVAAGAAESGDAPHWVPVRHERFALLRNSIDIVDNAGNLRQQTAWGRGGRGEFSEVVSDERIVTNTKPLRVHDEPCANSGWLWRTGESWTSDGVTTAQYGYTSNAYNYCGDLILSTRTATLASAFNFAGDANSLTFTQGNDTELASSRFDSWGQSVASCGGADLSASENGCLRLSKVTYDPAYQQLPVTEAIASSVTGSTTQYLSTQAQWDRGLGVLRTATDPNGYVSEVHYDGLGRLVALIPPAVGGCEGARAPSVRIAYQLTTNPQSTPLSRVQTTTLLSCAGYNAGTTGSQIVAYAYVDGLGRARAALAQGDSTPAAWGDASGHAFTKAGIQLFTRKGKPRKVFQTDVYGGSPGDYRAVLAPPNLPFARTYYDAFGRTRLAIAEDSTLKSFSYHALSTDVCDAVDNGAGCLGERDFRGSCTTERTDGHGRVIDQHLRQVTMDGARENHRLFSYYRPDGAVVRVVRALTPDNVLRPESGYNGLTSWVERRFVYDSQGRRIASEDPDTDDRSQSLLSKRTWRYLFNRVGDLSAVRDPRGCGQNFFYDLAGRLVGEQYVGCAEAQVNELPIALVGAGTLSLNTRLTVATKVHVLNTFDNYPTWANGLLPSSVAGVLGRATATEDRGQRSFVGYDPRGNVTYGARQVALLSAPYTLAGGTGPDGRPWFGGKDSTGVVRDDEVVTTAANPLYDAAHTYVRSARFDHAGRSIEAGYPVDPDFAGGSAPVLLGKLFYHQNGAVRSAELSIDGVSKPVVSNLAYTRDGLPEITTYGDQAFTGRTATKTKVAYDARRRPVLSTTTRSPASGSTAGTLAAVQTVTAERLSWDGESNLCRVEDQRTPTEWPAGHKPYTQDVFHDGLYRVGMIAYSYATANQHDSATDWRDEETRHRSADPMHATAAPMVASKDPGRLPNRVMQLDYRHDWLANLTSWQDDSKTFYERSIGTQTSGTTLSPNSATPAYRPSALYLSSNLDPTTPTDLGGWLETDYGLGGNLLALTVHAQCTHATTNSCADPGGTNLSTRRNALRSGCLCASEQHYVYRYDELNRLSEARRYDRASQGAWTLAARQRARYDGGNQRILKQSFDTTNGTSRTALYVYPGDFERRGMEVAADGLSWAATSDTETQYLVAGARVVWQHRTRASTLLDPDQRITFAITNLIGSTSAVVDLTTGELIEAGGFYPNGAREEWLGAADGVGGAGVPLEPMGFTGKEADEEVGLTYFGERYLVARVGRWSTPDPLAVHAMGGGEGLNSFHYVSGNLLQARDPLGLQCQGCSDAATYGGEVGADGAQASSFSDPAAAPQPAPEPTWWDRTVAFFKGLPEAFMTSAVPRAYREPVERRQGEFTAFEGSPGSATHGSRIVEHESARVAEQAENLGDRVSSIAASAEIGLGLADGFAPVVPGALRLARQPAARGMLGGFASRLRMLADVELVPSGASGARNRALSQAGVIGGSKEAILRFKSLNEARSAARQMAGLGDDAVDFVQEIGPNKGRVTGRMSPDGKRGWRIDFSDDEKGFHVNWWDRTGGSKRTNWKYGANIVEGGTKNDYMSLMEHFP